MKLYAHPFSSYSQKVLIALYENATPFDYRNLEELAANTELAALWPLKRFPVLLDDGRCILESSTIVAHLQAHHPGPICLIPPGDAGLEVHMLDRVFDNYVMTPMQKVVLDALRPVADRDRSLWCSGGPRAARSDLPLARSAARRAPLDCRRWLHAGRLRRRSLALLRRLGPRDPRWLWPSACLSRPSAQPSLHCAGGG